MKLVKPDAKYIVVNMHQVSGADTLADAEAIADRHALETDDSYRVFRVTREGLVLRRSARQPKKVHAQHQIERGVGSLPARPRSPGGEIMICGDYQSRSDGGTTGNRCKLPGGHKGPHSHELADRRCFELAEDNARLRAALRGLKSDGETTWDTLAELDEAIDEALEKKP